MQSRVEGRGEPWTGTCQYITMGFMYHRTGIAAAALLLSILAGCARAAVRTDAAVAEEGRGVMPSEQGARQATFALG